MFIYDIYRLDNMSLRIKLFQFLTSIMDIVDTVQDSFLKRRKNSTNLNTGNNSYKILKNLLQRKMLKQIKKERLLHQHRNLKEPHSMKDKEAFPFTYV